MSMDTEDWGGLASVYRAGARRARGWSHNTDRQQDAAILDAQADRCEEIAREQSGLPAVEHDHYHYHGTGPGRTLHAHPHKHPQGGTGHDDHEQAHYKPPPLFGGNEGPS